MVAIAVPPCTFSFDPPQFNESSIENLIELPPRVISHGFPSLVPKKVVVHTIEKYSSSTGGNGGISGSVTLDGISGKDLGGPKTVSKTSEVWRIAQAKHFLSPPELINGMDE